MKRDSAVLCVLLLATPAPAQEVLDTRVVGLRVDGSLAAGVPVIVPGGSVTVTIDFEGTREIDLRLTAEHCDRNWRSTASEMINDPYYRKGTRGLASVQSGASVRSYGRTYSATLPGGGLEPFRFSGNYRIGVVEEETQHEVAQFRVIVAERNTSNLMTLSRQVVPLAVYPRNEAHEVTVTVSDELLRSDPLHALHLQLVRVVDVYKNREWDQPVRIDLNDLTESTWVKGLGTDVVQFVAGRILPGNEYRTVDFRSDDVYPRHTVLKSRDGADVSRYFSHARADHNGTSRIVSSGQLAEFESAEFEVWWQPDRKPSTIHVVGDFSSWRVDSAWQLHPAGDDGRYLVRHGLKRGMYDYQYVVDGTDWLTLEGNSWLTQNVYTAVIYYADDQYGGFDRVIGAGQVVGNGEPPRKESSN